METCYPNQQLQQSITNLLQLIIKPFITTLTISTQQTSTEQTSTEQTTEQQTTIDQSILQQHCAAFSVQLHQSINQLIQSHQQQHQQQHLTEQQHPTEQQQQQQQQQHHHQQPHVNIIESSISPISTSVLRAQSEPNHPSYSFHEKPAKFSTTSPQEYPNSSLSHQTLINSIPSSSLNLHHPTASNPNNQDSISEDLRLCIQSEIEDGFNDLVAQFDESLQDAKHQLVSINRSLLESKLGRKQDLGSDQALPKPLTKIQVGSLGEKLKFQFESHLIDCYQDYLNRFTYAIGHTDLGSTFLDLKDDQQKQFLQTQLKADHSLPNKSSIERDDQNFDQQIDQTITKKFENYQVEFQNKANQFRNQIQDHFKRHVETSTNEMNETIDQIEKMLVKEKEELIKVRSQIDGFEHRINQLETQFAHESNPILQRSNVLKSLGLMQSNDESDPLQKLNLNIFLTKLNHHLKINLNQILIKHDNFESNQAINTKCIPESIHHHSSGPPQVDGQDSNQSNVISNSKSHPYLQQQDPNGDEEFIDKLIIKLITRMNQTFSLYGDEDNPESLYQNMPGDQPNDQQDHIPEKNDCNQQHQDEEKQISKINHEDSQETNLDQNQITPQEENHHHQAMPNHHLLIMDDIQQIHLVLNHFFDLNFKKFVWPKFESLVFQLENYLISQQI